MAGNSVWGNGFHEGRTQGLQEGREDGRIEGAIAVGLLVGAVVFGKRGVDKWKANRQAKRNAALVENPTAEDGNETSGEDPRFES